MVNVGNQIYHTWNLCGMRFRMVILDTLYNKLHTTRAPSSNGFAIPGGSSANTATPLIYLRSLKLPKTLGGEPYVVGTTDLRNTRRRFPDPPNTCAGN